MIIVHQDNVRAVSVAHREWCLLQRPLVSQSAGTTEGPISRTHTGTLVDLGTGMYVCDASAAEMAADRVTFRFRTTGRAAECP